MKFSTSELPATKGHPSVPQIDGNTETLDQVQVEIQRRAGSQKVLYVHVNGVTVLRICNLSYDQLEVQRS